MANNDLCRCIIHLDVDNFYVSVERADDPSLAAVPLVVQQHNSGGFVAVSGEAKACGLRKGDGVGAQGRRQIRSLVEMQSVSISEAKRRCPGLVVLPMRMERYREAGRAILNVLQEGWPGAPVEKTSFDDFYVDVSSLVARDNTGASSSSSSSSSAASPSASQLPPRLLIWKPPSSASLRKQAASGSSSFSSSSSSSSSSSTPSTIVLRTFAVLFAVLLK